MSEPKSFHMSPEEFRRHGHAVVDWITDYHSRIESFPVLSRAQPGEIRSRLPPSAPERGESFDQILGDIERIILPGWACKACSGPLVRRARNLKRMCLIGWSPCWDCRRNFFPLVAEVV